MDTTDDKGARSWTGRPWFARAIKLITWLAPIAVSIASTHLLARVVPRPTGLPLTIVWFIAMAIIATAVLYLADKLARRLLPLAALFQLSLVFPDRAPSRYKAALRSRTVNQLEERVAEIKASGLSDDPVIAAETLIELVADLSAHDRLTRGHAERVRAYSQMIGEELNLKDDDVEKLQWAGLLHDVGKMFVPDEILNKPGRLTDEEFEVIKKHPEWGAALCEPLRDWLGDWVDAVGQHHERWDGKGYPSGLAGNDISYAARIVAVADVFDVITSIRSYKKATGSADAREELAACAGTQFDEKIVRAFLNVSLGKLRLAMGPLSWAAQLPVIGRASLVPAAGSAASAVLTAGALFVGGSFDETEPVDPPRVEAAAPAPTVPETTIPITTIPETTVPASTIPETTIATTTIPVTTLPETTVPATTTTTIPPRVTLPVPRVTLPPPVATTTTSTTTTTTTIPPTTTTSSTSTTSTTTTSTTTTTVPPLVANDDAAAAVEGGFVDIDTGLNDAGVVSTRLLTGPTNGAVTQISPTVFRFESLDDWFGTTSFTYEVTDATGATSTAQVTVTVANDPDAPEAADDVATVQEYDTVTIDVLANDSDADGDALTVAVLSAPAGVATTDGTSIEYAPTGESAGVHTISYSVTDPSGLSDTASVSVTVNAVNLAPVLQPPGSLLVDEGSLLSFTAVASDDDLPADTLTFSTEVGVDPVPAGVTIDPTTGLFEWTPTEADGGSTHEFLIVVTDDGSPALSDEEYISVTVREINTAPVLTNPGDQSTSVGLATSLTVDANDPDDPANTLTFSAIGLPTGLGINSTTGEISGTPTVVGSGSVTVTATETDGSPTNLSDSETFDWTISNPAVLISEIATRGADGRDDEFVELYNATGGPVSIAGWKLLVSDGDDNRIGAITIPPATTLGANEYYLIAHDLFAGPTVPDLKYDTDDEEDEDAEVAMPEGAGVALTTDSGDIVDAVGTGPAPWRSGAGSKYGEGTFLPPLQGYIDQSYERHSGVGNCVDTDDNSADFFHNMSSRNPQRSGTFEACGTPPPFVPPASADHVVISEFRFDGPTHPIHGGGQNNEFVEIYNPTAGPIDISGYELHEHGGGERATVPGGTILPSGKHYLFASASFGLIHDLAFDNLITGSLANDNGVHLEDASGTRIDAVSTGDTPLFEGAPLPPISGEVVQSYERLVGAGGGNCVDTDVNTDDFFHNLGSENPQTLTDDAVPCAT